MARRSSEFEVQGAAGQAESLNGKRPIKLHICVPAHGMVPSMFAYDLARMYGHTCAYMPEVVTIGLNFVVGTYVHTARQELIANAVLRDSTHVLWIDSDMRFPNDALVRLLKHQKPMVGINYASRNVPTEFVAIKKGYWKTGDSTERLETNADSTGLEEVDGLGFGLVLMRTDILDALPDPRVEPWFWFKWVPELGNQIGEDIQFCKLVKEAGFPIHVDHDLSKECAHIGSFEYLVEHAQACREEKLVGELNGGPPKIAIYH